MTDTARYDEMVFSAHMRALYEDSGYYNVGDWSGGARTLIAACEALVSRHAAALRDRSRGDVVIDAGCGIGGSTAQLAAQLAPATVIGINVSSRQLHHAATRHDHEREREHAHRHRHRDEHRHAHGRASARYCVMDATRLAFADACAEAIVSIEAAFHFDTRETFLASAHRVLKPGGCLAITDILFASGDWVAGWSVPAANALPDLRAYAALCARSGFDVMMIDDVTAITWRGFCAHLRARGQTSLADGLEPAVRAYLFAVLRKRER